MKLEIPGAVLYAPPGSDLVPPDRASFVAIPPSGPALQFVGEPATVQKVANAIIVPALVCSYDSDERQALGGVATGCVRDYLGRIWQIAEAGLLPEADPAEHARDAAGDRAVKVVTV